MNIGQITIKLKNDLKWEALLSFFFLASVIFRLPRCTTETVHNHVNRFYMRLRVVQSSMLVHLNQNNKRRKVSSGMEMHASIKHQTFFINLNVLVLSGRLFYCKNFFSGRLKQTFSRLSPTVISTSSIFAQSLMSYLCSILVKY